MIVQQKMFIFAHEECLDLQQIKYFLQQILKKTRY
jgi:hypothetical protein